MPGKRHRTDGSLRELPRNTIRAWREYRGLTVEQLAELTDLSTATISNLENGKTDLSGKTLLDLANALATTPGALLDAAPGRDEPYWDFFDRLSADDKARAIAILKAWKQ